MVCFSPFLFLDTNTSTMNDRQAQQLERMLDLAIGGPSDFPRRSSLPQPATCKASLMSLFDEPLPTFQLNAGPDPAGAEASSRPATPARPNIFSPSFSAPPPASPSLANAASSGSVSTPERVARVAIPSLASPLAHHFSERAFSTSPMTMATVKAAASPSLEKPPFFTAAGDAPIAPAAAKAPGRVSTSRCYVGPVLSNPLLAHPSEGIQLLSREMIRAYFISYVWMYTVDQEPYGSSGGALADSLPATPPKAETGFVRLQAEQATANVADTPHLPVDVQLMKECLSEVLGRYPVLACRLSTPPGSSTAVILDSCNPSILAEDSPSKGGYGVVFDTTHVLDHPSLHAGDTTGAENLCCSLADSDAETAKLVHKPPNASVLAGEEGVACFKVTLFYSSKSPTFKGLGENQADDDESDRNPEPEWGAPLAVTVGVSMFHPIVDGSSLHRFINDWSDLCRIRGIRKTQKEAEVKRRAEREANAKPSATSDDRERERHFFGGMEEDEDEFPELVVDPPPPSQFDRLGVFEAVPRDLPLSELQSICSKAGIHISTLAETRLLLKCRELVDEKGLSMRVDFTSDELTRMRVHAEKTSRTWISRHEALAAHLSRVLLKLWVATKEEARREACLDTKVSISSTANGRGRPNSNIPSLFFGNAACYTCGSFITPRQCRDQSFGEVAQVWHDDLLSVSGEGTAVKNALWSQDVAIEYGLTKSFTYMGNPVAPAIVLNNRSKFPAFDVDFGWGSGNGTPFDVLPHHGAPGIKVYASKEGGARVYFKGSSEVLPLMKEFVRKEVAAGGSVSCDIDADSYGGFWLFSPPVEMLMQQQWLSQLRMFKDRVPDEV